MKLVKKTWDKYLPDLLFGLRRRKNAATGVSPSHLLMGRTILRPGEWEQQTDAENEPLAPENEERNLDAR